MSATVSLRYSLSVGPLATIPARSDRRLTSGADAVRCTGRPSLAYYSLEVCSGFPDVPVRRPAQPAPRPLAQPTMTQLDRIASTTFSFSYPSNRPVGNPPIHQTPAHAKARVGSATRARPAPSLSSVGTSMSARYTLLPRIRRTLAGPGEVHGSRIRPPITQFRTSPPIEQTNRDHLAGQYQRDPTDSRRHPGRERRSRPHPTPQPPVDLSVDPDSSRCQEPPAPCQLRPRWLADRPRKKRSIHQGNRVSALTASPPRPGLHPPNRPKRGTPPPRTRESWICNPRLPPALRDTAEPCLPTASCARRETQRH